MQFNWNISQLDRRTSDGFVTTAHWRCDATDGEFSASVYATCGWGEGEPVKPYDNLTEADVLAWVWDSEEGFKDKVEAAVAEQITAKMNPATIPGVPWS